MQINFDESIPIYVQIMQGVMWDVAVGTLAPGDKLLSVRDLARDARTNPNTVQRAYMELERMGIVETQRGQGTFIKASPRLAKEVRSEVTATAVRSFINEMRRLRYSNEEIVGLVSQGLDEVPAADGPSAANGQTVADGLASGQSTEGTNGGVH
ncbi:MAG TPA: GntR family transcriptional regulator [Firmicutes bacterium]|nr:GntR family transcriptional regulator [Bacillota bacterium]HBK60995.1 GntR family transcriptional regulator [Bacillota bacterium]